MMKDNSYKICTNCVMDTSDSRIKFDENGVCDHCNDFQINVKPNWHPNEEGLKRLESTVSKIKEDGKNKADNKCLMLRHSIKY